MKPKKFYIIRPEIEIEYMKNPILGRLYIMLNYWRFIKAGYYWIFTYKVYYIAFPRRLTKAGGGSQHLQQSTIIISV